VTVPEGWDRTDPAVYADERISAAGFDSAGPALLTGVEQRHARGAQAGSVVVVATVGLSNPAAFGERSEKPETAETDSWRPGTVNLLVGTGRALSDGALATLLSTVVEAKAAVLKDRTGFSGTTSDAVIVGCDPAGDPAEFAGSATAVGSAARACVRDALEASLESRYGEEEIPISVADADYGAVTNRETNRFDPG
jgi:adenosylcobinamide hydrolase